MTKKIYDPASVGQVMVSLPQKLAELDKPRRDFNSLPDLTPQGGWGESCPLCHGSSWKLVNQDLVVRCDCWKRRVTAEKLAIIPERFKSARLDNYRPSIFKQPEGVIKLPDALEDASASYLLAGDFGAGKTHLLYALWRKLAEASATCTRFIKGKALIDDLQKQAYPPPDYKPLLPLADLETAEFRHIFIDDFGKLEPTKDRLAQLFSFIDLIYEKNFKLTLTTNLKLGELEDRWQVDGDENYAGGIARRLQAICQPIYMFEKV